ncbi:lytic transglycosylase domain-containing protein [Rhodovulum euryhalinum]|uniref:Transglycosylase-like protein with SLT domain n=1 Tax=Rhodovulum euryhalinum TaxID=35805 RepID=A0A4R2KEK0_9RHOB|nr:lytic transglycosylase domain-containing protein [Rhodovulum euryhalinum]TCO71943.1 transglycosylase-like protein with SLT domain [Rhodovulum euryhalinum]
MTVRMMRISRALVAALALSACGGGAPETTRGTFVPGGTAEIRALADRYADRYGVPRSLVHRVIQRESGYRPDARNGPYYGLMQILPETARTMGFRGEPHQLLDAEINLTWAVKYLRGAWLLSDGSEAAAVGYYARGYYYDARDRCMLVETGLRAREVRKTCA